MDYSYCGYQRSETPIPSVRVAAYVQPTGADDADQLQQAIDWVSGLKPDKVTGLRGAVLLGEGTFTISEPLRIRTSGIVLRGSGRDKTLLRKTGYDRGALLYIEGKPGIISIDTLDVLGDILPGSLSCSVQAATTSPSSSARPVQGGTTPPSSSARPVQGGSAALNPSSAALKPGTRLLIHRPSTEAWIASLGCASFGGGKRMGYWAWHAGDIDLRWHRTVMAVNGSEVTLDAPLTCSVESRWGGAEAIVYEQPGIIADCGVENLTLQSVCDPSLPMDESHCWDGIYMADAENCWVRMVNFRHFAGSAVVVQKSARQVTVEDCKSVQPVSEIGGFRRRTFLTFGEMVLFQRCYSEHGINDFAVGNTAAGPNAFVQCESFESFGPSGAISSWAPGILFDSVNIDGNDIVFKNWELEKFGAGWSTAGSTMWQSTASGLYCYSPDTLNRNISHGCWGQIQGNGDFTQMNEHVKPYSLFQDQLGKRLNIKDERLKEQCRVLERNTNASSSPTIEEANRMAEEALLPRVTMQQWIDSAVFAADITPIKPFVATPKAAKSSQSPVYAVQNGWLCKDGAVLAGGKHQTPWWNGRTTDAQMAKAKPALTRFVPGYEGTGGTDRIDSVVADMQRHHTLLFSQNYGLWTDRRRDDHERIRRKDGDAWAPFYEQPFARTGISVQGGSAVSVQGGSAVSMQGGSGVSVQGGFAALSPGALAWDGLSKYDLTQLNRWYFYRLQQFAKKTESIGLLLKNQHYFQHNILEAGAHWVDCPWRTANNVNGTPFLEPVNFTGDKRIFTAQLFYDVSNPTLRHLHRQYIRQSLDAFKGQPNVIHSIGDEFTGPLHFVQFWLDVIAEWEQENGRVLVALAVNKDVQDAILRDPQRSRIVDIIDIEQWFYHNKGEYAPQGGVNMAPRQYQRKIRTGSARFEDVYRAVSEYRTQYPDKAVVYSAQKYPEMCWASLMAGGSCTAIPVKDQQLLGNLASMKPQKTDDAYLLKGDYAWLVYRDNADKPTTLDLGTDRYVLWTVNPATGQLTRDRMAKGTLTLDAKGIFWVVRK
ncbi:MAG: pectate lyase [Prevotella sp.]|nr:pectate lyase [Prevotella sp.]